MSRLNDLHENSFPALVKTNHIREKHDSASENTAIMML